MYLPTAQFPLAPLVKGVTHEVSESVVLTGSNTISIECAIEFSGLELIVVV